MLKILTGSKRALPKKDLNPHVMSRYDEFKAENLIEIATQSSQIKAYLPDDLIEKKRISKAFLVTVMATVMPEYIKQITTHAYK